MKGYFSFVLHAHMPYVMNNGQWPHGAVWLYEAAAESYIPLLNVFHELIDEGISPKVTMGITPILLEQLRMPQFRDGFLGYLDGKVHASKGDLGNFYEENRGHKAHLAEGWSDFYSGTKAQFLQRYDSDLVKAFGDLQEAGHIEIITGPATHGYLPLLLEDACISAQIQIGVETYRKHFGTCPRGIWLPECAYRPEYSWRPPLRNFGDEKSRKGIEQLLVENGIQYFFVDSHMMEGGQGIGAYGGRFSRLQKLHDHYAKRYTAISGPPKNPHCAYKVKTSGEGFIQVLARDPKTGLQVWSSHHGYPGDGRYLEFHKQEGSSGNRYWRVTDSSGDLGTKVEYEPDDVDDAINEHAKHFAGLVSQILKESGAESRPRIVTAPYDAELFGHWWFEGPRWIKSVLKEIKKNPSIEVVTSIDYLEKNPSMEEIALPEGSWGEGGHHFIWLNEWTDWIWRFVYEAEKDFTALAEKFKASQSPDIKRILSQMGRELLLLESSDWPFLVATFGARDYAELRATRYISDYRKLGSILKKYLAGNSISDDDVLFLTECERRDCPFSSIGVECWSEKLP